MSAPSSYLARELVALYVLRFKTPAQLSASLQHLFVWPEMHYSNNQNIVAINLTICRRSYIALSPQFRDRGAEFQVGANKGVSQLGGVRGHAPPEKFELKVF